MERSYFLGEGSPIIGKGIFWFGCLFCGVLSLVILREHPRPGEMVPLLGTIREAMLVGPMVALSVSNPQEFVSQVSARLKPAEGATPR
jgi:hypothetical protein